MLASQGHFYPPDVGRSEPARLAWAACSAVFMNPPGRRLPIPVPKNVRRPPAVVPLPTRARIVAADLHSVTRPSMIDAILAKVFGTKNKREIKAIQPDRKSTRLNS